MSHPCHTHWGSAAADLKELLDDLTDADPIGGWAYALDEESQFDLVVQTYYQLCLALNQPTIPPGFWADSNPNLLLEKTPIPANTSEEIATACQDFLTALESDGTEVNPGTSNPYHPDYGMPHWLATTTWDGQSLNTARNLHWSLRNALDR